MNRSVKMEWDLWLKGLKHVVTNHDVEVQIPPQPKREGLFTWGREIIFVNLQSILKKISNLVRSDGGTVNISKREDLKESSSNPLGEYMLLPLFTFSLQR